MTGTEVRSTHGDSHLGHVFGRADNVRHAVRQLRIEYPVAIDNDDAIWRAFRNQYWPALYFIDARGRVRQHHFGEGEYQRSESNIRRLLAKRVSPAFGSVTPCRSMPKASKPQLIGPT